MSMITPLDPLPTATDDSSPLASVTPSPVFTPSSLFSTPTPTTATAGAPVSGGNQNNNNNTVSAASSASLYLYTFLATLVLLLSVSAAIVVRSFILRRRHRRMVEEAIRNGTWAPPGPLISRASRHVDLSKKPKMWEVYLGGGAMSGGGLVYSGGEKAGGSGEEWHAQWDNIQPFSAVYVSPTAPTSVSVPQGIHEHRAGSNVNLPHPATTPARRRPLLSRITRVLNRTSSFPSPQLPIPTSTTASPTDDTNNDNNDNTNNTTTTIPPGPPIVRVAVLIAMPSQRPQSQRSSPSLPSTSHPLQSRHANEGEELLPYLDVGVAELPVLNPDPGPGLEESRRKESMGSSIDV